MAALTAPAQAARGSFAGGQHTVAALGLGAQDFYPVPDGYQDSLPWTVAANQDTDFVLEALTPAGEVVQSIATGSLLADQTLAGEWNGRDASGRMAPMGDYVLRASVTDGDGLVTTSERAVTLRPERVEMVTSEVTVSPQESLRHSFVGACSRLSSPSSHGWQGSLGYYSKARCKSTHKRANLVTGTHSWWLPTAVDNKYGKMKVLAFGGKARDVARASVVMGYLTAGDQAFSQRVRTGSAVGWHAGRAASPTRFIRTQAGRPFVSWTVRASGGSRYDIKSFRLRVSYQVLVDPTGATEEDSLPRTAPH